MKKYLPPLLAFLIGCSGENLQHPVSSTPTVVISEVAPPNKRPNYDAVSAIEKIVSELNHLATKEKAESKTILHLNQDSDEKEEREVYRLQETATKIRLHKSHVIISLRDIYQDGNIDLELRVIIKEGEMKIYRDIFPFGNLNEFEECKMEWKEIIYYSCSRKTATKIENRSFANIVVRIANNLGDSVPLLETDYHYTESRYILERDEAIVHMINFKSPYK